jgi:hypothetical protein
MVALNFGDGGFLFFKGEGIAKKHDTNGLYSRDKVDLLDIGRANNPVSCPLKDKPGCSQQLSRAE